VWGWGGDFDPGFLLSIFLTSQINGWSDSAWSDPQYDRLYAAQAAELDPQKRKAIIWQMEQIIYQQSPYVLLVTRRPCRSTTRSTGRAGCASRPAPGRSTTIGPT